jgi:hypothetical protein
MRILSQDRHRYKNRTANRIRYKSPFQPQIIVLSHNSNIRTPTGAITIGDFFFPFEYGNIYYRFLSLFIQEFISKS